MVKRFIKVLNTEWNGLHEAAFLLGIFALLSQVLALVRDRLLASQFGAGATLDAYYSAFRIPDFLYASIASLVAITVLIPFLVEKISQDETRRKARVFLSSIFSVFLATITIVCLGIAILLPRLAPFVVPGFDPETTETFLSLTRLLLLSPVLFGLSNLLGVVTQTYRKFFVFAIGPVLYNLGIILGIVVFSPTYGVKGVAFGVLIGACLHLLVQVPVVLRERLMPRVTFRLAWADIQSVIALSLPRTLGLASGHIAMLVLVAIASYLSHGSIAIFTLAMNMQSIPLSTIGMSYSVAAFPTLVALHVKGRRKDFLLEVSTAARHIIFWSFPAIVLFVVLRAQVVRTILGSGLFDWTATRLTAAALAIFALSVLAQSLNLLFVRAYYAMGNTRTPLVVNVTSALGIVLCGFMLIWAFDHLLVFRYFLEAILRVEDLPGTDVLMLPLAYSLGMLANMTLYLIMFRKDFPEFLHILKRTVLHSFTASILMGYVAYHGLQVFERFLNTDTTLGIFLQGAISGACGIIALVFVLRLMDNREVLEIGRSLRRRFWKARPIVEATEGL